MTTGTPWSDDETLHLLDLIEAGSTYARAAKLLADLGFPKRTRNACIGEADRVRRASEQAEAA